jgi:uncharacterized membrane protein YkvA (DUF1232 family)
MLEKAKQWAKSIKRDVVALYLAGRDPRTPWYAKVVAILVAAYAISPIDLIPDFIPILGYLDDLIIVPLGILLAVRLIPALLMAEFRAAAVARGRVKAHWSISAAIITLWIFASIAAIAWALTYFPSLPNSASNSGTAVNKSATSP